MNLPKPYLSFSAIDLWETFPKRFRLRYYENKDPFDGNRYTDFGKKVHDDIENGLLPHVPVGTHHEHVISITVAEVPLYARIDSVTLATGTVYEHKTGKNPWTQGKVNKHKQLPFYLSVVRAKHGLYDHVCHLNWLETEEYDQEVLIDGFTMTEPALRLTGHWKPFQREVDDTELDAFETYLHDTALAISNDYAEWTSNKN
jgi:hypothetical protein